MKRYSITVNGNAYDVSVEEIEAGAEAPVAAAPAAPKAAKPAAPKETVTYNVGDVVEHSLFGKGTVQSVKPMANDSMLEVAFENKGTKKIMANYAKMKKL